MVIRVELQKVVTSGYIGTPVPSPLSLQLFATRPIFNPAVLPPSLPASIIIRPSDDNPGSSSVPFT